MHVNTSVLFFVFFLGNKLFSEHASVSHSAVCLYLCLCLPLVLLCYVCRIITQGLLLILWGYVKGLIMLFSVCDCFLMQ